MAVKNSEIMALYRAEHNIPETTELYTYSVWKSKGYQVKRGEASHYRVQLWKYKPNAAKAGTELQEGSQPSEVKEREKAGRSCFMKTAHLFTRDQVEPIK